MAISAVVYVWVLWDLWSGTVSPLRTVPSIHSAYDLQARAIMHGRLSIPTRSIGLEGFVHDGRTYTYFGVFPSIIRLPVLLATHSLDGRLTALSMFVAWLATALSGTLLIWRIRILQRGDVPLGWAEATSYGLVLASVLIGSVLLFLGSQPNTYSEDISWSVALACATLFALAGVAEHPSWARVVASGVLLLLTNLNRATTGYACVLAALLLAGWFAMGRAGLDKRRWAGPLAVAGIVSLAAGCLIDLAKFGIPFGFPASSQLLFQAFGFAHLNSGHYWGLRYLPSTIQAYMDPTGLRVTSLFPYITLPDSPGHAIAHTLLFTRAPTASVPASMPLLFAASLWGVVVAFTRQHRPPVHALRLLLVAALIPAGAIMIFGWILERFVGDFMPLLVLAERDRHRRYVVTSGAEHSCHAARGGLLDGHPGLVRGGHERGIRNRSERQLDADTGRQLRRRDARLERRDRTSIGARRGQGHSLPSRITDGAVVHRGRLPSTVHRRPGCPDDLQIICHIGDWSSAPPTPRSAMRSSPTRSVSLARRRRSSPRRPTPC